MDGKPLTVKELIDLLKNYNPDAIVGVAEEVTEEAIYSADIITEETAEKDAEE